MTKEITYYYLITIYLYQPFPEHLRADWRILCGLSMFKWIAWNNNINRWYKICSLMLHSWNDITVWSKIAQMFFYLSMSCDTEVGHLICWRFPLEESGALLIQERRLTPYHSPVPCNINKFIKEPAVRNIVPTPCSFLHRCPGLSVL